MWATVDEACEVPMLFCPSCPDISYAILRVYAAHPDRRTRPDLGVDKA